MPSCIALDNTEIKREEQFFILFSNTSYWVENEVVVEIFLSTSKCFGNGVKQSFECLKSLIIIGEI